MMPRMQFGLKTLFAITTLAAVGCLTLPQPIRAIRRWLQPTHLSGYQMVSPRIAIMEEDESLLGIPEIDR